MIERFGLIERRERKDVLEKNLSIISGITYTGKNLAFVDAQDHTMNFIDGARVTNSLGGT